jgi:hypothetical protein
VTHRNATYALAFALTFATSSVLYAWNGTGHEIIARIAWQNLTPTAKANLIAIMKSHPDYDDAFKLPADAAGADHDLYAFLLSATWPDMVRSPGTVRSKYNRPVWHYADIPFIVGDLPAGTPTPEQPSAHWDSHTEPKNAIEAFQKNVADLENAKLPAQERAVAISWIEHLVGDIHQPLHAVSLFSTSYPTGDRGGNSIIVTANSSVTNLHSLWDGMLGNQQSTAIIDYQADRLMKRFPQKEFATALTHKEFADWAAESFEAAKKVVYLDGHLEGVPSDVQRQNRNAPVPEVPAGYISNAMSTAEQRAALAGYRLAQVLNTALDKPADVSPASKPAGE